MQAKAKLFIKFISFVLVTCLCVSVVNEWLKPKYYYNDVWPSTNTFKDFYKLEKNSVDVLFFGSSHAVSSLNPQVIYDTYGITSYNLGSEQQSLVVTYYWLREALKYQSPKAVVIDTYMIHKFSDAYVYNDMNCSEAAVRKAMDNMRLSPLKWEAAQTIAKTDPTQDSLSYIFPNIRYHSRWTSLGEDDFTQASMVDHGGTKGFTVMDGSDPNLEYTPFYDEDAANVNPDIMMEPSKTFLGKTIDLCREKGIQVILINIPCAESIERYRSTKDFADSYGVPYYDFNEASLYYEIGYNASEDLLSHPNYHGAEKISLYIGKLLSEEYGIAPREDASYDASRQLYQHKLENLHLAATTDIYQYLPLLSQDRHSIFIFAPTAFSACIDENLMNTLFSLGFATELREVRDGTHYCAVKDSSSTIEQLTEEDLQFSGAIRNGLTSYSFVVDTANMTSKTYKMTIDGADCSGIRTGLNFVIYDNEQKSIIDRVNFDTTSEELTATRY